MGVTFFKVSEGTFSERWAPWGATAYAPSTYLDCPECGRKIGRFSGDATTDIEYGREWTDAIGTGTGIPPFFVSERVVDSLHGAGVAGFDEHAVQIGKVRSKPLRILPPPRYSYLDIRGRAYLDLEASGIRTKGTCALCFNSDERSQPERFVVQEQTWDGSGLFVARNFPSGVVFCSDVVLELARAERWSNFRFVPADLPHQDAVRWDGIDYLGKKWPPKMRPDPPSAGKGLEEWVQQLRSKKSGEAYKARLALIDLGREAIAHVAPLLHDPSDALRREAAIILYGFAREAPLDPELEQAMRSYLEPHLLAVLDARGPDRRS